MVEIHLKSSTLAEIANVPITNTLFTALIVYLLITFFAILIGKRLSELKPSKTQIFAEMIYTGLGKVYSDITNKDFNYSKTFAIVMGMFLFVLFSNWFGLLPISETIGFIHTEESHNIEGEKNVETSHAFTALSCLKNHDCIWDSSTNSISTDKKLHGFFRAPTSDISITLSLALISVFLTNFLGIKALGLAHITKFFNFKSGMGFFVGILEFVSELGKIISFAFRLFGNVFAGEVLLLVITFLTYGLFTLPFYGLEIFVGFIQAFVFFMLTTVFISLATSEHH